MESIDNELHRVTSTAIIYRRDDDKIRYLITKRSDHKKAFPGKWTVPGGGLERDDYINEERNKDGLWYSAIEKSLRREVKEEVNLEVDELYYLLDIAFLYPNSQPAIILSYYGEYKSGEVKLDEDNIDYAWVTVDEVRDYDLIDGIFGEIEMVENILNQPKA